jgi:hypothetical protein
MSSAGRKLMKWERLGLEIYPSLAAACDPSEENCEPAEIRTENLPFDIPCIPASSVCYLCFPNISVGSVYVHDNSCELQ